MGQKIGKVSVLLALPMVKLTRTHTDTVLLLLVWIRKLMLVPLMNFSLEVDLGVDMVSHLRRNLLLLVCVMCIINRYHFLKKAV